MRRREWLGTDLIGKPINEHPEPSPAVDEWSEAMAKAKNSGTYILDGHHFIMEKGQVLPDGAEIQDAIEEAEEAEAVVEERAEKAAPENRAKKSAPENR
jgi:hypothetical protein